ncbi:hypothetical protein A2526_01730 [candidate division WOR-1 bacterium RIFOXYD2_FULL_36_8]|uniref:DUF86 domain-containing protein n=1 Tax=candidate division WOR-1 bacterium RIFOXYB2_FULL_36_35 TaxID=1802578 RepID=A0A1F4S454_UNCSA|nr:MAG: hypothetical protein A2230_02915 [candidate division WOR-1 bacterium RIFOXYA2_FULL_36_21]OGC15143.1 MAG: hypothetical protein A2282_09025 [candidate division WOR-1 bacterium RIFOXYA12_FULL_36_13]OGC15157.1 MAG: hypothetical protein A2290_08825 [candidate division WOR-1 bacterium RIFOXYB2_FULL_36_35]OGC41830.1 MAG: hypothetical protein A2526_01730 [candidate division WOR-1 bacterium RIFOXYD2_FULL_36_8]
MHESARHRLIAITDFAENEIADLQSFCSLDYKTYLNDKNSRRLVEKIIENIANATIDAIKIAISEKRLEMPDSYADIMKKGGEVLSLSNEEINNLVQIAKLRNILAHEYLDIKWEKISLFLKDHQNTVKTLLKKINSDIKNSLLTPIIHPD